MWLASRVRSSRASRWGRKDHFVLRADAPRSAEPEGRVMTSSRGGELCTVLLPKPILTRCQLKKWGSWGKKLGCLCPIRFRAGRELGRQVEPGHEPQPEEDR